MSRAISKFTDPGSNFIITSPTTKIMSAATLPAFMKVMKGKGKLNKTSMEFIMNNDRRVFLRTWGGGKDPNAIEGITDVRAIWNDEVGMLNRACWTNIEGRSAFKQCQIFNTTTPYALNFLYSDIYKPFVRKERDDIEFVQFKSIDNPHFPKDEFERQRSLLDPRVFAMMYEGKFERMAGLVYQEYDEVQNIVDSFDIMKDIRAGQYFVCAGVDWGFTNQFAMSIRCIHKQEIGRDYQVDEFYQTHLTPTDKVLAARNMQKKWQIEQFYCDNESPDMIEEFVRAGLKSVAAPKGPGIKLDGIHRHQGLIKQRHHQLFRHACPHTEEEYQMYHYEEDEGLDKNISEVPVDANNHLMDANRYVTQMTEFLRKDMATKQAYNPAKNYTQAMLDGDYNQRETVGDWYE